jgi:hypothetical protein
MNYDWRRRWEAIKEFKTDNTMNKIIDLVDRMVLFKPQQQHVDLLRPALKLFKKKFFTHYYSSDREKLAVGYLI